MSTVVLSHPLLCPVVCEWWGRRRLYVGEVSRLWTSCSLILLIKGQ